MGTLSPRDINDLREDFKNDDTEIYSFKPSKTEYGFFEVEGSPFVNITVPYDNFKTRFDITVYDNMTEVKGSVSSCLNNISDIVSSLYLHHISDGVTKYIERLFAYRPRGKGNYFQYIVANPHIKKGDIIGFSIETRGKLKVRYEIKEPEYFEYFVQY